MRKGEIENRLDPDMILYRRKLLNFAYSVKSLKSLTKAKPQYGSNQAGIERESQEQARYIRITDIDEYGLLKDDLGATAEFVEEKYLLNNNDILFARSGATVGKAYLHKTDSVNYECFFAGYMIRFLVNENLLLPDFLFSYTQLEVYKNWKNAIQRAAGQPNINAEEYNSLPIPVPPLEVQRQIIEKFEAAYNAKRAKETEAKNLLASIDAYLLDRLGIAAPAAAETKKSFFTRASKLSGGRFDPKKYTPENERLLNSLSKGNFNITSLKNLIVQSVSGDWGIELATDGYEERLVIRATEFDNRHNLRLENNRVKFRFISKPKLEKMDLQADDLLIEKSGGSDNQPVGRIALITKDLIENYSLAFSNFIHKIRVNNKLVKSHYLFEYLKTIHNLKITDLMQSQTNGIRNLIMSEYLNLSVALPPLEVQEEIAAHIQEIRGRAKDLETEAQQEIERAKREVEAMILGEVSADA